MAKNEWVYDNAYKNWFYLKSDGSYANQEWHSVGGKWYYFKKWGYMAKSQWQGNYFLNGQGAMMQNEWLCIFTQLQTFLINLVIFPEF